MGINKRSGATLQYKSKKLVGLNSIITTFNVAIAVYLLEITQNWDNMQCKSNL